MIRRKVWIASAVLCSALFGSGHGIAQRGPNPATTPKDRLSEDWWAKRHQAILARLHSDPDVQMILVGDSITNNYDKSNPPDENFQPTWQQFYAPRKALNLGFSGDATEHVLWRLDHGEVDGIHPEVAVVLIGTNNTNHFAESAADTELGIDAVVQKLKDKLPETRILLMAILPSGLSAEVIAKDKEINRYLAAKYGPETGAHNSHISYIDIGSIFYRNGKLNEEIFYDPRLPQHAKALHPDTIGQQRMAEAIEPTVTHLFNDGARQYLASLHDVNSALIPVPRLEMDSYDWYDRHRKILAVQKQIDPQVVMIGDSITHFWGGQPKDSHENGPKSWDQAFHGLRVLNMGFGWDRTQNVLWRLSQGEFDGLHPKTVVINIGTNNLTATENARSNTPDEIVAAILAIHHEIRAKSPDSRIIVMGILPRGFSPIDPFRAPIAKVNELLAHKLAAESNTTFLDIESKFLKPDGALPPTLMSDGTHPTEQGYALWAQALIDAGIRQ
jgi:lysophospholipase L1-like esterase